MSTSKKWIGSLVGCAALVLSLGACGGERSGAMVTSPVVAVTLSAGCTPTADGVTVTWSGTPVASVKVSLLSGTKTASTAWVNVTSASSGSALVALPAGVDTTWLVDTIAIASSRGGKGDQTSRQLDCATVSATQQP